MRFQKQLWVLLAVVLLWGTAGASTVWQATDGDMNLTDGGALLAQYGQTGIPVGDYALFQAGDSAYSGGHLAVAPIDRVTFTRQGSGWLATSTANGGSLLLLGAPDFRLGAYDGSQWLGDSSVSLLSNHSAVVSFPNGVGAQLVDVQAVPVPGAALLMASGLLALGGMLRRRG